MILIAFLKLILRHFFQSIYNSVRFYETTDVFCRGKIDPKFSPENLSLKFKPQVSLDIPYDDNYAILSRNISSQYDSREKHRSKHRESLRSYIPQIFDTVGPGRKRVLLHRTWVHC